MKRLLRIEFRKMLKSRAFLLLFGGYLLMIFGMAIFIGSFKINITANGAEYPFHFGKLGVLDFPYIWHNVTYVVGFMKYILVILIVIFITNEFSFRTVRQNVIDGMSRTEYINSKLLSTLLFGIASTVFVFLITLILGFVRSNGTASDVIFMRSSFLVGYFIELMSILTFAFFMGLLIKRAGFSIIAVMVYAFVIEPLIGYKIPEPYDAFLPISSSREIIDIPFKRYTQGLVDMEFNETPSVLYSAISLGYIALWSGLSHWLFAKRDL